MDIARIIRRIRSVGATTSFDRELDEEMQFHLDMEVRRLVQSGLSEQRARAEALRAFGLRAQHADAAHDARGIRPVEDFLQDIRVAWRTLWSQRTYAIVAILTLAIGIGATTALAAAVYRVLLQPYPFVESDRIVVIRQQDLRSAGSYGEFSPGNYIDLEKRSRAFEMIAAAEPYGFDGIGPEGPENFRVALVTRDLFPIQGLRPIVGRGFRVEDFEPGSEAVVLLTESLWRTRFGADSSMIGRTLTLDSVPRMVVGVMPSDALEPYGARMWAPKIYAPEDAESRANAYWSVLARLAPGVTIDQARADVQAIAQQLAAEHPATNRNTGFVVTSLRDAIAGGVREVLLVLLGAVAFVLLIACVNVANLQLAECVRRQRELAIRTAIGAGRNRLIRQLLTESLLIASIGSLFGLVVAHQGIAAIRAFAPSDLWQLESLQLGGAALLFATALAAVTAFAIAILPIIATGRLRLAESLAAGGRSGAGRPRRRANRLLVVSEVALALVLLVGAGLLLRSLTTLLSVDRGFRTDNLLIATVQAWGYYPTGEKRASFVRDALAELAATPGIEAAGMTSALPLSYPIGFERPRIRIEGHSVSSDTELPGILSAATTPGYFEALGIRVLRGRMLASTDVAGTAPVALVNAAFVRRYFPDVEPLGKRLSFGFMGAPLSREIVGVVNDVRHDGLHAEPAPGIFIPHAQAPTGAIHFIARTTGEPLASERVVRSALAKLNAAMPLSGITTMEALLGRSLRERRFQITLLATFSTVALVLAAIGIYGVMNRATRERTHEIGVRLAVGADVSQVRWMVMRSGGTLAVTGIIAGIAMAFALTRYMTGMLYGVRPMDPWTYAIAALTLLVAALLATWLPAWRASRVDPVEALRND